MGRRAAPASRDSGVAIVSSWGAYFGACTVPQFALLRSAGPQGLAAGIHGRSLLNHAGGVDVRAVALDRLWRHLRDWVLVAANRVGAGLSGLVLAFKIRDLSRCLVTK
jgi:hypothetical protein